MRKSDIAGGAALGLVSIYLLSVSSTVWVTDLIPGASMWAPLLSAGVAVMLGLTVARRASMSIVTACVMGAIVAACLISLAIGVESDLWRPIFPQDVLAVLFHGSRSPIVVSATVLVGVAGLVRLRADSNARGPSKEAVS